MGFMAEHVFESPLVEEFYNSCHLKSNGRFCGVGAKGRGVTRVPMSDAARASNAALRAKAAKTRKRMKAGKASMEKAAARVKPKRAKEYGSGKTEPGALKLTQKYGTRNAPRPGNKAAGKVGIAKKGNNSDLGQNYTKSSGSKVVKVKKTPSNIKYGADNYGSGKTSPGAASLTAKYGTRGAGRGPKKTAKEQYGSGKTDPKALSLTERYGTRRRG